jgi:uncharacterized protein YodC (DUF2158 family)
MAEFKPGDNVRVKLDGAPRMVVNSVNGDQITCIWFMREDISEVTLHEDTLKLIKQNGE